MKTLIVSKTIYGPRHFCVGGLVLGTKKDVRLLTSSGDYQDFFTKFEIGDYWDIDFIPKPGCVLPHSEDVLVFKQKKISTENNLKDCLLANVNYWRGGRGELFERTISFDENGRGFLQKYDDKYLPANSVGFWKLPFDVSLQTKHSYGKIQYRYESCEEFGNINLPYIGSEQPIDVIPFGTLVRISLARWFDKNETCQLKCYLNLSGWYLDQHKSTMILDPNEDLELPF